MYALQAACDCYVALHRSEGFGLAVAECMYLGKPVIATGWSATAEYLDANNGLPVQFSSLSWQRPAARTQAGPPEPGTRTSPTRPSRPRRVHGDPADAQRLGAAARATIEARFSPAVIGARYKRRLETIACL